MKCWGTAIVIVIAILVTTSGYEGRGEDCADIENVVVIFVDTLAAQHLGFMGYERETSPVIDEFASRSVIFNNAYTPKSTTCPAYISFLSGLHPADHGVLENGVILPDDIHLLTDDLRHDGCAAWGIPAARVLDGRYGFRRGFDYYANTPAIPHDANEITNRIERILDGNPLLGEPELSDTEGPLFLLIHFYDTHTEYTPDDDIRELFCDPFYDGIVDGTWAQFEKFNNREIWFDDSDLRHARDLYDAEIRTFDRNLEHLFDLLTRTGLMDNSLIVFTADHGENLGEHQFITHGHPYESSLHIPLLFHFPGDAWGGMRIDTLVELTDVMPTILDLFDMKSPVGIDGSSMLSLIDLDSDGIYIEGEHLYSIGNPTVHGRTHSIFDGTYRLIAEFSEHGNVDIRGDVMLYDIPIDPTENFNLIDTRWLDLERMAPVLGRFVVAASEGHMPDPTPETREMLASLGYL